MAARVPKPRLTEHGPAIAALRSRRNKSARRLTPAQPAPAAPDPRPPPVPTASAPPAPRVSPFDEHVRNLCATCLQPFTYRVGDGYTDRCPSCLRRLVEDLELDVANLTAEEESLHEAQRDLEAKEEEVEEMKKEIDALRSRVADMETELHDALDLVEKMKERAHG